MPLIDSSLFVLLFWAVAAYLIGSVPFGMVLTRAMNLGDLRSIGSGNIGATNVLRIGGKPAAALTLLGDVLKGVIPVVLARYLDMGPFVAALVGTFAFLGHLFPVFFHFQGGKGVATAFGLLFALHWPSGLVAGVVWLLVFALTRISSLASLSAFVVAPACIFAWLPQAFWPMLALSLVMILRHRSNLQKLLRGEELGFRKKD